MAIEFGSPEAAAIIRRNKNLDRALDLWPEYELLTEDLEDLQWELEARCEYDILELLSNVDYYDLDLDEQKLLSADEEDIAIEISHTKERLRSLGMKITGYGVNTRDLKRLYEAREKERAEAGIGVREPEDPFVPGTWLQERIRQWDWNTTPPLVHNPRNGVGMAGGKTQDNRPQV